MIKKFLTLTVVVLAVGCNDSGSGGGSGAIPGKGLPELSLQQKQQVLQFNTAVDNVSVITQDPNQPGDNMSGMIFSQRVRDTGLTPAQQELVQKMDEAKQANACRTQSTGGTPDFESNQPTDYFFSISGSHCPISFESKSKVTSSADGSSQTEVSTDKFAVNITAPVDLNLDIQSYDVSTRTATTQSQVGNPEVGPVQVNFNVTSTMKGTAQTFSMGRVVADMSAKVNGVLKFNPETSEMTQNMNMTMTITEKFAEFSIVGHVVGKTPAATAQQNPSELEVQYYLNGEEVSNQEFAEVFGDMAEIQL